jgi:hypothetical protein
MSQYGLDQKLMEYRVLEVRYLSESQKGCRLFLYLEGNFPGKMPKLVMATRVFLNKQFLILSSTTKTFV